MARPQCTPVIVRVETLCWSSERASLGKVERQVAEEAQSVLAYGDRMQEPREGQSFYDSCVLDVYKINR